MSWLRQVFFNFYYYLHPPWDTGISPPELFAYMENHAPGRALDLGCGTGTNAITLAKHGWEVTGIDFANRAIRIARQKAQEAGLNVEFLTGDVTKLVGFSEQFDLVLDIGCFHSLNFAAQKDYIDCWFTLAIIWYMAFF
jgi:ubiquinone/menaquinone biosynthesis C-methylase UbiE